MSNNKNQSIPEYIQKLAKQMAREMEREEKQRPQAGQLLKRDKRTLN